MNFSEGIIGVAVDVEVTLGAIRDALESLVEMLVVTVMVVVSAVMSNEAVVKVLGMMSMGGLSTERIFT